MEKIKFMADIASVGYNVDEVVALIYAAGDDVFGFVDKTIESFDKTSEVLFVVFPWEETPQGREYWETLCNSLIKAGL